MARKTVITIVVGQVITYKPAGKLARCEGMAGKPTQGTVTRLDENGDVAIMPHYRKLPDAEFPNMGAIIDRKQIIA